MCVCKCVCAWCDLHVHVLILYRWGSPNCLISRLRVSVVNPLASQGRPPPPAPPPPPVLLSPPHRHLHRWVLLFPHRILIMAIERFQRGWFTPLTPAQGQTGVMMQVVSKGGKREDPTNKPNNSYCKQRFSVWMFKSLPLNS